MTNIIPFRPLTPHEKNISRKQMQARGDETKVTTGNRVEQTIRRAKELQALRQGDSFTDAHGTVHVLSERISGGKRQLLLSGAGESQWVAAEPIHAQMPEHYA